MCKWLLDNGEQRNITMLYGISEPDELAFRDLFKQTTTFIPYATQPNKSWQAKTGRITTEEILKYITDDTMLVYIAGPEHIVEAEFKALQKAGLDQTRLIADYFPGYHLVQ